MLKYLKTKYVSNYAKYAVANASSYYTSSHLPEYAFDFTNNIWHPAINKPAGEYVTLRFPYHIADIKGYSIKTSNLGSGHCHPRQWSFSVSNDEGVDSSCSWHHEKNENDEDGYMNSNLREKYISFDHGAFRRIKITITGAAHCGTGDGIRMDLNQIELYGTLYDIRQNYSMKRRCRVKMQMWAFVLIVALS